MTPFLVLIKSMERERGGEQKRNVSWKKPPPCLCSTNLLNFRYYANVLFVDGDGFKGINALLTKNT